jgi:hypothetical protein
MEIEEKRLHDEFVTLKLAIEEAIVKGRGSSSGFSKGPGPTLISNEHSISAQAKARPGVIGWVDDL